jgi:hypothetical protein
MKKKSTGWFIHLLISCFYLLLITSSGQTTENIEYTSRSIKLDNTCYPEIHIHVIPPETNLSYAIEEYIPTGLIPSNISHNGVWDSENFCIKWGLFNEHAITDLSYQLTGINSSILLVGHISLDGVDQPIGGISEVIINCMPEIEQLASPVFEPPDGSIVPVDINITSEDADVIIRYTLDGSLPDENSTPFETPFSITNQSVIRAKAFKQDYLSSETVTSEYFEPSRMTILRSLQDVNTCLPVVKLAVTVQEPVHSYALLEQISEGLYPENISHDGVWNPETRTIKWGIYQNKSSFDISYNLRGLKGDYQLSGYASVNGTSVDIGGTSSIALNCDIEKVSLPKFEPRSGTPFPVDVTITCDTPDAIIHYTLDGSIPDQESPIYSNALPISSAVKIKAIAYKTGMIESPLAVAIYPKPTYEHILLSRFIDTTDQCNAFIEINVAPIIYTQAIAIEEIIPTGLFPSQISHSGIWDETTHSIKWGLFYTNNPIQMNYRLTGIAGNFILNGEGSFDGYPVSITGDTAVMINCMPELEPVANPVFEPSQDSILPVEVLIHCDTPDATIYYTTDGSLPDQQSTQFITALTIDAKTVIRAIAFKSGMSPSDIVTKTYVETDSEKPYHTYHTTQALDLCTQSVTIEISPVHTIQSYAYEEYLPAGVQPSDISDNGVWLENNNSIRWGLFDDSQQRTLSYIIKLPAGLYQIQAYASFDGYLFKEETTTIESECGKPLEKVESVIFSPESGSQVPADITMISDTPDITIYYTVNGQLPDETSTIYDQPIHIDHATTIRAIVCKQGMQASEVNTSYYKKPAPIQNIKKIVTNDVSCRPHITFTIVPSDNRQNYAIEEHLDNDAVPVNISHDGQWDDRTHTIRWGILRGTNDISYDVYGENGSYDIYGEISVNGDAMPLHDTFTVTIDCFLAIDQGESINVIMNEDGQFFPPTISAMGPSPETIIWQLSEPPLHGTATVTTEGLSPEINFYPDENWFGDTYFSVMVSDANEAMDVIQINVSVNSINDPPVFTLEKTELDLTEDFFPQNLTPTKAPTPFGENNQTITFRLEPAEINVAHMAIDPDNGKVTITSKADKNGNEIINIIASDGQLSYTQTFLLNVTPVNDPPEFMINSKTIELNEDFPETIYIPIQSGSVPQDEIFQTVIYSILPETVNWAELSINPYTGCVSIKSIPDKNGSGQFIIKAYDGADNNASYTQTFTLNIRPENDPPLFQLSKTELTVIEDFTQTEEIVITPEIPPEDEKDQNVVYRIEPEPTSLTLINVQLGTNGVIQIKSKDNQNGNQRLTVIANDGQVNNNLYSKQILVQIQDVNDTPIFDLNTNAIERNEDFVSPACVSLTIATQPPDESNQQISFSLFPSTVDWVNIQMSDRTGEVCFNSVPDKNGQDTFIIRADDHQLTNNIYEKSFSFSVYPVNDPPYFDLSESEVTLLEDFLSEKTLTITPQPVPSDEKQQRIIYTITPVSVDFANISIHPLTGQLTISSIPNKSGYQSFTITADDRQSQNSKATKNFVLNVEPRNDPPEFKLSQPVINLNEDFAEPSIISINPLPVPEDEQNEQVVYYLTPMSVNWVNINVNNLTKQIEITAIENASGHQIFSIIADDGQREDFIFEQPFELTVNAVNDSPIANAGNDQEVDEGTRLTLNGYQSSDIDNNDLSYQWKQLSGISAIIENENNSIAYVHVPKVLHDGEQIIFRLIVSDGKLNNVDDICISIRNIVKQGDINDDGHLNLFDIILMLELISDINDSQNQLFTDHADINLNGYIELADVLFLIKLIAE